MDTQAQSIIYPAFINEHFTVRLMKSVHCGLFIKTSYDEFRPGTVWSLENAFTTAFKELAPVRQ